MFKSLLTLTLSVASLSLTNSLAQAEGFDGKSVLCSQRNQSTSVGFSTEKFRVAICFANNQGFYVGQNIKTGEQIILPLEQHYYPEGKEYIPYIFEHGGLTHKAVNKNYTYQVFLKNNSDGCGNGEWVTLSVFKNGNKIYHRKVNNFVSASDC